jgi:2-amino-4-hydroxy-6-hydroxymethyldihydropteridine diphosphokinase
MGSNLSPSSNLVRARFALERELQVVKSSRVYETAPAVGASGPLFLNAALSVTTDLDPSALKHSVLRPLEAELGRVRGADRNAPRTIDLDISYFDDLVLDDLEAGIVIPDPDALSWAHVALPLADLAPDRVHPTDGRTFRMIALSVQDAAGVRVIAESLEDLAETIGIQETVPQGSSKNKR